ncbi:MAG: ABC transporter permease [Caldisericia bacterium]|jgi:peptide/nickel transport system permease protein|nr:ABC transporter permease [Caldisericia bacterium]
MRKYILRRAFELLIVLFIVSIITFLLIRLVPGDPAQILAGEHVTEKILEEIREKYGLNKPIITQYFIWISQILRGDFGRSIRTGESVIKELFYRFANTFELSLFAILIATLVGVFAGIISATKRGSFIDYLTMTAALFGVSMPVFWLGIMLMLIFGIWLNILPVSGRVDIGINLTRITNFMILDSILTLNFHALLSILKHLILPSIALATIPMAFIARITRSSMLDVLNKDYIRTAKAKGVNERVVIYRHALRNALIPVITSIGTEFALLLGGAILTETVFAWPGLGRYIVGAVSSRDYPVVQGSIIFVAFIVVIVNLIVDILYAFIDPRIRY